VVLVDFKRVVVVVMVVVMVVVVVMVMMVGVGVGVVLFVLSVYSVCRYWALWQYIESRSRILILVYHAVIHYRLGQAISPGESAWR
jgi:hypothetical protein